MTQALVGVEMESPEPEELAQHWGQIIGIPAGKSANGETQIVLPNCTFSFVKGFREIMSALTFRVERCRQSVRCRQGQRPTVAGDSFFLGGVTFLLTA